MTDSSPPRFARGAKPIGRFSGRVVRQAVGKRGFAQTEVLTRWATIVGPDLAAEVQPERLRPGAQGRGGVLDVRAPGALAVELQYRAPDIIERVNAYFGYRAVERIQFVRASGATVKPRRAARVLPQPVPSASETRAIEQAIAGIADGDLKSALASLGRHIVPRKRQ